MNAIFDRNRSIPVSRSFFDIYSFTQNKPRLMTIWHRQNRILVIPRTVGPYPTSHSSLSHQPFVLSSREAAYRRLLGHYRSPSTGSGQASIRRFAATSFDTLPSIRFLRYASLLRTNGPTQDKRTYSGRTDQLRTNEFPENQSRRWHSA